MTNEGTLMTPCTDIVYSGLIQQQSSSQMKITSCYLHQILRENLSVVEELEVLSKATKYKNTEVTLLSFSIGLVRILSKIALIAASTTDLLQVQWYTKSNICASL